MALQWFHSAPLVIISMPTCHCVRDRFYVAPKVFSSHFCGLVDDQKTFLEMRVWTKLMATVSNYELKQNKKLWGERLKWRRRLPPLWRISHFLLSFLTSLLSSHLLSSTLLPAAPVLWIRCWAGWPDRKCFPPPSVRLCKRRSREKEREELFLTQAGCRRRKNERVC